MVPVCIYVYIFIFIYMKSFIPLSVMKTDMCVRMCVYALIHSCQ